MLLKSLPITGLTCRQHLGVVDFADPIPRTQEIIWYLLWSVFESHLMFVLLNSSRRPRCDFHLPLCVWEHFISPNFSSDIWLKSVEPPVEKNLLNAPHGNVTIQQQQVAQCVWENVPGWMLGLNSSGVENFASIYGLVNAKWSRSGTRQFVLARKWMHDQDLDTHISEQNHTAECQ